MMHFIYRTLSVTLLVLMLAGYSQAGDTIKKIGQYVVTSIDTANVQTYYLEPDEVGRAVFTEKLDDLVSSWYINNIFLPGNLNKELTINQYINISDSLIISRLKRTEAAVKLSYNSIVRDYIEMYILKRPAQMEMMLGLSAFYFPFFEETLDRYGLPLELKYLPVIESALNPRAQSRAGATGLWQFMYGTAKGLDLEVSTYVDERRDILRSTEAAARYLQQLYYAYQDWHLVIAAYNCGPGNVNKAIARTGGKTDYWQIYFALPRETRGYVPAYIAAAYVMNYYREHGLSPRFPAVALNTDTIVVNNLLNLKQISDNLGYDLDALRDLNPMYRRDIIPGSPEKGRPVRVPIEHIATLIQNADTIYNHERAIHFPDNTLVTPQQAPSEKGNTENFTKGKTRITYTVKSGDTPGYVANWFDISVSELKKWNKISKNVIRTGQKLSIYVPENKTAYYKKINSLPFKSKQALNGEVAGVNTVATESPQQEILADNTGQEFEYYTVKRGDNFWTIAKKFPGVSNKEIMRLNNITDARSLRAGQKLKIKPRSE